MSAPVAYSSLPNEYQLQSPPPYTIASASTRLSLTNLPGSPYHLITSPTTIVRALEPTFISTEIEEESVSHERAVLPGHPHYKYMLWSSAAVGLSLVVAIIMDMVFGWQHFYWYSSTFWAWLIYFTIPVLPIHFIANIAQIIAAKNRRRDWLLHASRLSVFFTGIAFFCLLLCFSFADYSDRWHTGIPLLATFPFQFCYSFYSLRHLRHVQPPPQISNL